MFWTIVGRTVDLVFLLVALTILGILWSNSQDSEVINTLNGNLETHKNSVSKSIEAQTRLLEDRVNSLASTQDSYQSSTFGRISVIESKVETLSNAQVRSKIISNNTNTIMIDNTKSK